MVFISNLLCVVRLWDLWWKTEYERKTQRQGWFPDGQSGGCGLKSENLTHKHTHTHTHATWTLTHIHQNLKRALDLTTVSLIIRGNKEWFSASSFYNKWFLLPSSVHHQGINRNNTAEANEKSLFVPTCHASASPSTKHSVCQTASWTLQEHSGLRCAHMPLTAAANVQLPWTASVI